MNLAKAIWSRFARWLYTLVGVAGGSTFMGWLAARVAGPLAGYLARFTFGLVDAVFGKICNYTVGEDTERGAVTFGQILADGFEYMNVALHTANKYCDVTFLLQVLLACFEITIICVLVCKLKGVFWKFVAAYFVIGGAAEVMKTVQDRESEEDDEEEEED